MGKALSLISKLHESGSRFIVESLKANGIMDFSPSHGDILAALYTKNGKKQLKIIELHILS